MGHSDNHNHPAIDETSDSAIAEHPTVPGEGFCRPEDLNRPESAPAPTVIYAWALQEAQEGTLFATTVAATTALSSGEFDPAVDNPPPVPAHVLAGLESPPFRFPQAGVNPFVGATAAAAAASSRLGDDMNDEDSHNGGDENDNYDMLVPPPCPPELPAEGVEVPPALPHTICDSIRFDCDGGDDDKAVTWEPGTEEAVGNPIKLVCICPPLHIDRNEDGKQNDEVEAELAPPQRPVTDVNIGMVAQYLTEVSLATSQVTGNTISTTTTTTTTARQLQK
ncbi:hypothetical protein VTH82DRAFT_1748 [Thermothelomyces myriococcoides]